MTGTSSLRSGRRTPFGAARYPRSWSGSTRRATPRSSWRLSVFPWLPPLRAHISSTSNYPNAPLLLPEAVEHFSVLAAHQEYPLDESDFFWETAGTTYPRSHRETSFAGARLRRRRSRLADCLQSVIKTGPCPSVPDFGRKLPPGLGASESGGFGPHRRVGLREALQVEATAGYQLAGLEPAEFQRLCRRSEPSEVEIRRAVDHVQARVPPFVQEDIQTIDIRRVHRHLHLSAGPRHLGRNASHGQLRKLLARLVDQIDVGEQQIIPGHLMDVVRCHAEVFQGHARPRTHACRPP